MQKMTEEKLQSMIVSFLKSNNVPYDGIVFGNNGNEIIIHTGLRTGSDGKVESIHTDEHENTEFIS